MTGGSKAGLLSTLQRGLRVLELIADGKGESTAQAISKETGLKVGSCYQILRTLAGAGYVEHRHGGRYALGTAPLRLAQLAGQPLSPPLSIHTVLRELHQELDESLYITFRQGSKIVVVDSLEGTRAVRVGPLNIGYGEHPHARATTKCFLAFLPPAERAQFLANPLPALTPRTITDLDDLHRDLDLARARGFAVDEEEFSEGVGCVSAILLDVTSSPVGSIGVSAPIDRLRKTFDVVLKCALDGGARISRELGFAGEYPAASLGAEQDHPLRVGVDV